MTQVIPTVLAVVAVGLMVVALLAMASQNLAVAGMCFLSASLVIYLRETRFRNDGAGAA
ncbi:hypothetical protein [Halomicrococcus gelatinilyticus]|uniref:hypothetical protein n=1 Tax=Halomicrococcus gelatinilyticus TaxID=1702103 RepID=UPI002E0FEABD